MATLAELYGDSFVRNWERALFSDYESDNFTYAEVAAIIKSIHLFFQVSGIRQGDKVGILGRNSSHWGTIFLSSITAGTVVVPILPDFTNSDTDHIINHSESKIIFASKALVDKINVEKSPLLETIVLLDDFSILKSVDENASFKIADAFDYYKKNPLSPKELNFWQWQPEDCCAISYTSGTSGFAKGVMIPERSLVSNIVFACEYMPLDAGNHIVSFLPMAHVYGLLFEFLFPVTLGCHITFLSKIPAPQVVTQAFQKIKPHLILSVPLVIEKIYKKNILPTLKKPMMRFLCVVPGISNLIYKKVRQALNKTFGEVFYEIVIGGAPMSADVEKFFRKIKFRFTVGYGMTECGPLISYIGWDKAKLSSAGKLVDRIEVRIDSEDPYNVVGEIQVRGQNVMLGYYKNEEATKEAFTDDGWLRTGDLGIIDAENFIFIKGRSKNMLLGPSGQNIYPEEIESKLTHLPYISECVVVERNKKLVALVYPDHEVIRADKIKESQLPFIMAENLKNLNAELPKYENISEIKLVSEEFEKTPKKNIKRYKYM